MIAAVESLLIPALLAFCRIGACLMLLPGFSSARVPVRVRLSAAVVISAALAPWVAQELDHPSIARGGDGLLVLTAMETISGTFLGLLTRAVFAGLQFAALVIASTIGFAGVIEPAVEDNEPTAPAANLVMMTATLLWFLSDQHLAAIRGLLGSYAWLRIGGADGALPDLGMLVETLARSFEAALQMAGPFILYGILVNVMFGILNRMIPQIPVYFISMPFVVAGGLLLLFVLIGPLLEVFLGAAEQLARAVHP